MIGYVTVEVQGADMDSASRHAQRLASNFLDDLDDIQRTSRARDRRAMSQLETGVRSSSLVPPATHGRAYSYTRVRSATPFGRRSSICYYPPGRNRPYRRIPQYSPPITMVGGRAHFTSVPTYWAPVTTTYLPTWRHYTPYNQTWYYPYTYGSAYDLPTSGLRAHRPTIREHILTPRARDYFDGEPSRSHSIYDVYDEDEQPLPRIRSTNRRTPAPFVRLTSVPPQSSSTYRPVYYASEVGLPPVVPRTYYRTNRYFTETPQYRTTHRVQTPIQKRRTYTTQYSSGESPVTYRYTYSYPSEHTYQSPVTRAYSYTNLSPEVTSERRRIERRMDDLLNYKLPPPDYYHGLRGSLRSLQDKMDTHKRLIDRYVGIDMNTVPTSVEERIESKCQQLAGRMPEFRSHGPALETSKLETQLYYESPQTTLGYGEGIMKPMGGQISELRGRIKRLLCRSKHDPHYFRF